MLTPEVVLPILKWAAILSVTSAVVGGVVMGYLDIKGVKLWPLRRKGK